LQFVTWNGTERYELAPSAPVTVPVTLIGSQLVGLNMKPGAVDGYVDVPYLRRDAIEDVRERVRGISHPGHASLRTKRGNYPASQQFDDEAYAVKN